MTGADENLTQAREAFALLGHDLRLEILLALLDHWEAAHTEPQRYSELMRTVGIQDSGKFNYHLGKLRGTYLRKADGGYLPTASATALYRAVLAHRPTETSTRSELNPGVSCPVCDEPLVATYEREFFALRCTSCEGIMDEFTYPLPKNALEGRSDQELLKVVYDRARTHIGLARRGQCPACAGTTSVIVDPDSVDMGDEPPVGISCDTCSWMVQAGFLLPLLTDARVVQVLSAIGLAIEDTYPWELPDPVIQVVSTDPPQFALKLEATENSATITVDDSLDVLSVAVDSSQS